MSVLVGFKFELKWIYCVVSENFRLLSTFMSVSPFCNGMYPCALIRVSQLLCSTEPMSWYVGIMKIGSSSAIQIVMGHKPYSRGDMKWPFDPIITLPKDLWIVYGNFEFGWLATSYTHSRIGRISLEIQRVEKNRYSLPNSLLVADDIYHYSHCQWDPPLSTVSNSYQFTGGV